MMNNVNRGLGRILIPALIVASTTLAPSPATAAPARDSGTNQVLLVSKAATEGMTAAEKKKQKKRAAAIKKAKAKKARAKKRAKMFGERMVRAAASQAGDPYRYGATGPNAFDCSGLTSYAAARTGKRLPRTSSAQRGATKWIAPRDRRRGDLVFFHGSGGVYHVGVYAGNHTIWHAPYTGTRVRKERIWTSSVSYGRIR